VVPYFSDRFRELTFGITAAAIAAMLFIRGGKRNVLPPGHVDIGVLGGRFHDFDSGADVEYRVKRLPIAMVVSHIAGMLASFIGIGGGILIVPALNSMCGVPVRAAAATSVCS
jgi:uncharacterized membrane protein YfcA